VFHKEKEHLHVTLGCLGGRAGCAPLGKRFAAALLGLLQANSKKLLVVSSLGLCLRDAVCLNRSTVPLALQAKRGHKALDLGCLAVLLAVGLEFTAVGVHVLADVIVFTEVKQLTDLGCTLGTTHTGHFSVSKAWQRIVTVLNNGQVQGGQVGADNATAARLATALTVAATIPLEAGGTPGHKEADTSGDEHTLLHGETLLVLTTVDLEDVALEILSKAITLNLSGQTLLEERAKLAFVIDLHLLLATRLGVSNVQLHVYKI